MSTNANWGKPVLDELRLCYVAEPSLLEDLSKVEVGDIWIAPPFILFRQGGDRFEFTFAVCLGELGEHEEIGLLKYGRYGAGDCRYDKRYCRELWLQGFLPEYRQHAR